MTMTPEAKRALSTTIRGLRASLLDDLHAATESTYLLSVSAQTAALDEAAATRRARLEQWIGEQLDAAKGQGKAARTRDDFRREAEKQAAYTLLNRLVLLRLMEAPGPNGKPLRAPAVVTGGWESRGYKDFREVAKGLLGDETDGYAFLLQLVFEDLATDLPGLYGPAGVADLVPIPAATLRHVIDELDDPDLASCWADDMTLGWVYQYWNDPEREALDAKLNSGGKVEPHEIASKTQMFTERYMVDWLLQNSLGPMWLAMCKQHGWTPDVVANGTLAALEQRRVEWRKKREAGEVELTTLMPLHNEAERRWAYYVPQEIPQDAVEKAPKSVKDLKILDPAVGSGHFLVVALDLLVALYREEAKHRGEVWSDKQNVEHILAHNLHGIDLDPRAVQIAAAALWLKARQVAEDAHPEKLNLVASNLRLAGLRDDDPALIELRTAVEQETGIPGHLTNTLVHALKGADHLGSLLKVDQAVDEALKDHENALKQRAKARAQLKLGEKVQPEEDEDPISKEEARTSLLGRLEVFLNHHTSADDLGLRLRGEQLATGVRFVRMVREGSYDLVVANPPYQGTSKMTDAKYVGDMYPLGKADLYAAFLLRGLELVRSGGVSSLVTMRNWMFIKQYAGLREHLLSSADLRSVSDLGTGAFSSRSMDDIISTTLVVFRHALPSKAQTVAIQAGPVADPRRDADKPARRRGALMVQEGHYSFDPAVLKIVPEWPLVYWWNEEMLRAYQSAPLIGKVAPAAKGLCTCNDVRYLRAVWECRATSDGDWVPSVHGGKGKVWVDPCDKVLNWRAAGAEIKVEQEFAYGSTSKHVRSPHYYFRRGVAFSMIGATFNARIHRYPSIFGNMGSSVFPDDLAGAVCAMNSTRARRILESLNPGVHFEVGDVNRLPLFPIADADKIFAQIEAAFTNHESHREPSVEYKQPGPSPWRHAQEWAQLAVDRPEGAPLPEYIEQLDPEPPTAHLSFSLGVALGRFSPTGQGILDPHKDTLSHALPDGLLFLDSTLADNDPRDSLGHPAAAPLVDAWKKHGPAIAKTRTLRAYLALDFFRDVHKGMYENRPIHWPLSSSNKTFVAWVNIHRFTEQTFRFLLADHLYPALARLKGVLADLTNARDGADKKVARAAEKQLEKLGKAKAELDQFLRDVEQCADRGAPPADKCPPREQDARYAPDLDDGVMVNAAALWPLLDPQWKDPKKWWRELCTAKDRKDYDWSKLAMRYFPTRVDAKAQQDPSLGVAHGCFWRYHPGRAWAWELRLQDEIGPAFRIEEAPYRPGGRDVGDQGDKPHREAWLRDHAQEAIEAIEREAQRRMGRSKVRKPVPEMTILEAGLWSAHAEAMWSMELAIIAKQKSDFRLLAPDEPTARAAFEAQHPHKVEARRVLLADLAAQPQDLPMEDGEEGEESEEAEGEDEGEDEG